MEMMQYQNQNKKEITFDVYSQYQYYYPEYNLEKILKQYKMKNEKANKKTEFRKKQMKGRNNIKK